MMQREWLLYVLQPFDALDVAARMIAVQGKE